MKINAEAQCAQCPGSMRDKACTNERRKGKSAKGCPTASKKTLLDGAMKEYGTKDIHEFARNASIQEGECYAGRDKKPYTMHPVKPRILEICEFAEKMGYKKLLISNYQLKGCIFKESAKVRRKLLMISGMKF